MKSLFTLGIRQDFFGGRLADAPAPAPGPAPSPSPAPAPAPTPDFFQVPLPYYYPYPQYQQQRTAYQVQAPPVTKVEVAATPIPTGVWIGGGVALAALLAVVAFK